MDPGYDVEPRAVGRSTHRSAWLVVLTAAGLVLGVALLKPWAVRAAPDSEAVVASPASITASPAPVASPEFALIPIRPEAQTGARLARAVGPVAAH